MLRNKIYYIIHHISGTLYDYVEEGQNITTSYPLEVFADEQSWLDRLDELGIDPTIINDEE